MDFLGKQHRLLPLKIWREMSIEGQARRGAASAISRSIDRQTPRQAASQAAGGDNLNCRQASCVCPPVVSDAGNSKNLTEKSIFRSNPPTSCCCRDVARPLLQLMKPIGQDLSFYLSLSLSLSSLLLFGHVNNTCRLNHGYQIIEQKSCLDN
jgi:hypothetical protein